MFCGLVYERCSALLKNTLRQKGVNLGQFDSYLSAEIIQKCKENQIDFCFLLFHSALKRPDRSKQCHCLQLAECIADLIYLFYFTNLFLIKRWLHSQYHFINKHIKYVSINVSIHPIVRLNRDYM